MIIMINLINIAKGEEILLSETIWKLFCIIVFTKNIVKNTYFYKQKIQMLQETAVVTKLHLIEQFRIAKKMKI